MAMFSSTTTHVPLLNHSMFSLKTYRNWALFFFKTPSTKLQLGEMFVVEIVFWGEVFCQDRNRVKVIVTGCLESVEAKVFPTKKRSHDLADQNFFSKILRESPVCIAWPQNRT